jgi:hypothetical protein
VNVGLLGSSSIDFTSIPSTYKHLEVRAIMRTSRVNNGDAVYVRFNSVSSAAYSGHRLEGNGSSAAAYSGANETSITLNRVSAASDSANIFGACVLQVLDYANTNKNKTLRALVGYETNSDGVIGFDSGAWYNTSAITSLSILPLNATGFVQYSSFALYGIKG